VPNGIILHPEYTKTIPSKEEYSTKILFLSNYSCTKGVLTLMDALNILNKQGLKFKVRLVGAPLDLTIEFLKNLSEKYKLSEIVEVTGPLYDDQKIREFQNADIFVFPTYYNNEAFPLVLLEAIQFGLPVISTFEGGIPDIVLNNETGFLIESQNAVILAEKIAILLNDKDLSIKMGKKGYERFINNYTIDHFENNMKSVFQNILVSNHM